MLTDKTPGPLGGQAEHRGDLLPFWRVFWAYGLCFSTLWSGIFRFAQPFRPRKAVASYWRRIKSSELAQSAHVVGQVLQPDLHLRPRLSNGTDEHTAHVVTLRPKHMLDARANAGLGVVALLFSLCQRLAALCLAMDFAAQLLILKRLLGLR